MEKYNVVILAGGRCPWLKEAVGTDVRCLAKINGKRMLDYIVEAIRESGRGKRIILAVSAGVMEGEEIPEGVEVCEAAEDLPATGRKAVEMLNHTGRTLFICDDIPMLHGAAINDFLDKCEAMPEANTYYPLIPKAVCESSFPQSKRTYVRIKEGLFTGGNLMLVDASLIAPGVARAKEIFAKRKKPFELVKLIGIGFIFKFLFHKLTLAEVEKKCSAFMNVNGRAVISSFAEIGMDIDKPEDFAVAEKYLG